MMLTYEHAIDAFQLSPFSHRNLVKHLFIRLGTNASNTYYVKQT